MIQFDPNDPSENAYKIIRVVKESGFSLQEICDRMKSDYGVEITPSGISHSINRGSPSLKRALQILAICGVSEVGIEVSDAK